MSTPFVGADGKVSFQDAIDGKTTIILVRELRPITWLQDLEENRLSRMLRRMSTMSRDYRCPFDFIVEHKKWFEWKRREILNKEPTGQIAWDMLGHDLDRLERAERKHPIKFVAQHSFQPRPFRFVTTSV